MSLKTYSIVLPFKGHVAAVENFPTAAKAKSRLKTKLLDEWLLVKDSWRIAERIKNNQRWER